MERQVCFKCNIERDIDQFYKNSGMKSGHVRKCKECNKRDVSENYYSKQQYYKDYDRNRQQTKERRELKKVYRKRYYEENRMKKACHRLVCIAKKRGILVEEPCGVCGSLKVHAHHNDYLKPLEVKWLCSQHHTDEHKRKKVLRE